MNEGDLVKWVRTERRERSAELLLPYFCARIN